jgi:A/G-specific adenine glycosylase
MTRSRRRTKAAKSAVAKAATCAATPATAAAEHAPEIARKLLAWYDRERRDLPWRAPPGTLADPYAVWLSEIMLQQTTVKAVIPYYRKFLALWPSVEQLAAADEDAVLAAWAGLGYYSRARNLHACAKAVVADHAGRFPSTERDLLELPGIGPYTAAAIAAIAFGRAVTPVDGNIERVTSRLFEIEAPLPKSKPEITAAARALAPDERAGDFAQAMMDLGATICTPKRPSCLVCPIQAQCRGHKSGDPARLPLKAAKPERPTRYGVAFVALREDGAVLLRRRPDTGLLARMIEVPSTIWDETEPDIAKARRVAPVKAKWNAEIADVVHTFTHFRLELRVLHAVVPNDAQLTIWADGERCRWVNRRDLHGEALPSVMRKVLKNALDRD